MGAKFLPQRSQSLLAYLLLHRHSPQSRQQIAAALWPDLPETEAKTSLRRELYRLKQLLPQANQYLCIQTKTLQWLPNSPFRLDVAEFEAGLAQAADSQADPSSVQSHLEQAIHLYRGELLPQCYEGASQFCNKYKCVVVKPTRIKGFKNRLTTSLTRLGCTLLRRLDCAPARAISPAGHAGPRSLDTDQEQQHDYAAALPLALRLLQLDPLHELGYQALMRSHQGLGDRAAALKVYHQCLTTLRDELGIDPSPTTQQLYHQALTAEPSPELPTAPPPLSPPPSPFPLRPNLPTPNSPLVGRTAERQTLQTWLSAENTALLLIGEPGIGKTRLLEELTQMVQTTAGTVLQGRGFEAELLRPYGAWVDALRSLPSDQQQALPPELGALLPELGTPAEPLPDHPPHPKTAHPDLKKPSPQHLRISGHRRRHPARCLSSGKRFLRARVDGPPANVRITLVSSAPTAPPILANTQSDAQNAGPKPIPRREHCTAMPLQIGAIQTGFISLNPITPIPPKPVPGM